MKKKNEFSFAANAEWSSLTIVTLYHSRYSTLPERKIYEISFLKTKNEIQ